LERWPLLFLVRCFSNMYKYFIDSVNNGYRFDAARKMAIYRYRKQKAIEQGRIANRKKNPLIEDLLTVPIVEPVDPEGPGILLRTGIPGARVMHAPRPRRERENGPRPRRSDLYQFPPSVHTDSRGRLLIKTNGRSIGAILLEEEETIRESLGLSSVFRVAPQVDAQLVTESSGMYEAPTEQCAITKRTSLDMEYNGEQPTPEPVPELSPSEPLLNPCGERILSNYSNIEANAIRIPQENPFNNGRVDRVETRTAPGRPVNALYIRKNGRSYERTIEQEAPAIRRAFGVEEEDTIFEVVDIKELADAIIVSRRPRLELASYVIRRSDIRPLDIALAEEERNIRTSLNIPNELNLRNCIDIHVTDTEYVLRKKIEAPRRYTIRKEGFELREVLRVHDNVLRTVFGLPRNGQIMSYLRVQENAEDYVFTKRNPAQMGTHIARAADAMKAHVEEFAREEHDEIDEDDDYYDDDYDPEEEEER
jgi:hypothetical protein